MNPPSAGQKTVTDSHLDFLNYCGLAMKSKFLPMAKGSTTNLLECGLDLTNYLYRDFFRSNQAGLKEKLQLDGHLMELSSYHGSLVLVPS